MEYVDVLTEKEASNLVTILVQLGVVSKERADTAFKLIQLTLKVIFLNGRSYQLKKDKSKAQSLLKEE
jgi:Na+-transporting methylmalonyl-CoA/oxaloacetate decarboxylase beta subunit